MRFAVMRIFERYVAMHVIVATLLSLVVLLALFLFIGVVDDLGRVGRGDYTVLRSLEYVALSAPRLAFSLFPVAAVIGSLLGLGVMAANSELVVLRSSGISVVEITGAVLKAGALLMIAALLVGEFVAPFAERIAEQRRANAIAGLPSSGRAPGFWARDGNSFVNVRGVNPGNRMEEVFIYEFDESRRLRVATRAAEATFSGGRWDLTDVAQTRFDGDRVTGRNLGRARWESQFEPDMVNLVALRPESLSALGLLRYIRHLESNLQSAERFELALWTKLAYPIATGVMVLLAVPLVLGRLHRAGLGARMLVGAILGVSFHIANQATGHLGLVYNLHPVLTALAPTALFLVAALWMLRRLN